MKEPFELMPLLFGWSLWWNGWHRMEWGRPYRDYSFGLGPLSLERGYIG